MSDSDDHNYDAVLPQAENLQYLVGKTFTFEDGDSIKIMQIKRRDSGPWVTYAVQQGPGIPRNLTMGIEEFVQTYGHLFDLSVDNLN